MSTDLVEIALDSLTDGTLFEKLAAEIMRDEGYHDIIRLGGVHDHGIDAVEDVIYEHRGRAQTIFQFTLEDYVLGKLHDTVTKLIDHKIDFSQLIIVTRTSLSAQRHRTLITQARKSYDITLLVYDRKTIVNRLADFDNGIFHRFFPSIQQQLATILSNRPAFMEGDSAQELAMLRAAIAFVLSPDAGTIRKSLFDRMVTAVLASQAGRSMSVEELTAKIKQDLGAKELQESQVSASLARLRTRQVVEIRGEGFVLADAAVTAVTSSTIKVNRITESLISDVVEEVVSAWSSPLSVEQRRRLERNATQVLRELLRLNSIEVALLSQPGTAPIAPYLEATPRLLELAQRQTSPELGRLLVAGLAKTIRQPSPDQAAALASWARVYVGAAIMNLDPALRECQLSSLRRKTFVLDTDIVLTCIVSEVPKSIIYRTVIEELAKLEIQLVVPEEVILECVQHVARSHRTYHYFRQSLLGLTAPIVDTQVRNLFVRGYYYGIRTSLIPSKWTFDQYLRNYYDSTDATGFVREIITNALPRSMQIMPLEQLAGPLDSSELARVSAVMFDLMRQGSSVETRTKEENEDIAQTDARLLLSSLDMNTRSLSDKSRRILWASCYIMTRSSRYIRAARALGLTNVVCTRPQQVAAIIEQFSGPILDDSSFVQLFENPLLTYAVHEMWEDITGLVGNGIELTGKSLVRLRRDIDISLHDRLSNYREAERKADDDADNAPDDAGDQEYLALIDTASTLGYQLQPLAERVRSALESEHDKEAKIRDLEDQKSELETVIQHFGKRKQRYLRRISRKRPGEASR